MCRLRKIINCTKRFGIKIIEKFDPLIINKFDIFLFVSPKITNVLYADFFYEHTI